MTRSMIPKVAALVLLWGLLHGCKDKQPSGAATPPEVEVVAVEQRDVPVYGEWVGTLSGDVNATISAQVTGYLISRSYVEGSAVTNGQVLYQINPAPFEAALARAKAQLEEALAHKGKTALDVKRYTPLAASQAISQQELDDAIQADLAADGQVASARASVLESDLNLGFTTVVSPVDGVAGLTQAQVGDLVGPSSGPLTTVSKVDPMRVYISVSQQLLSQIQERMLAEGKEINQGGGPPLDLILASGYAYPLKGQTRFKNNQVDVRTGTIQMVGEFPNPQGLLVPGMFTRVRALLQTDKDALLVPQRSVAEMQGRYLIAIVNSDHKVNIRPVSIGERIGEKWVIKGDVKAGDYVVAEGIQKVREGADVNPVPFVEKPATTLAANVSGK